SQLMKTAPPRYAVASVHSEVENYVGREDKLIVPRTVIVSSCRVGMIKSKLGTNSDEFVRPPGDTDGVFRIIGSEARSAAHLVVHVLVADREECIPGDPEHRVIHN